MRPVPTLRRTHAARRPVVRLYRDVLDQLSSSVELKPCLNRLAATVQKSQPLVEVSPDHRISHA